MRFFSTHVNNLRNPFLFLGLLLLIQPSFSQEFIADSSIAKEEALRSIPVEFINKARTELVIAYQHTSHGTHVTYGISGLQDYKTGDDQLFGISFSPDPDKLEFRDYAMASYAPTGVSADDLSVNETAFIQTTRNYLDAPENETVNVVMWSWCDIAGHDVVGNYLPGMDSLIAEYGPGGSKIGTGALQREVPVSFIFMTGHANKNANTGALNPEGQAASIVNSCLSNQQYCLDYYSIDTHDMVDTYFDDTGDNGDSDTYGGNFYQDWQDSHTLGEHYFENKSSPGGVAVYGVHNTQHITANRKAYAMWWILARIAGWDGSNLVSDIQVASEGDTTEVMTGGELQFSATVMPDFADNPMVNWRILDGTGTASISSSGLLNAGYPGMVGVVAYAIDGSGVADTMDLTIIPPLEPVTGISVTTAGGALELDAGSTLLCSASVLPLDATNTAVIWSVVNGTGSALVSPDGLVTGVTDGTVEVIATAEDGTLVADMVQLTVIGAVVLVEDIEVSSAGDETHMLTGEDLQCSAAILPLNASNPSVIWNVYNRTGTASVSTSGLVTALSAGTVNVVASAADGSGERDSLLLTITDVIVQVSGISIASEDNVSEVEGGQTLQFTALVLPADASNPTLIWSVINGTGLASVSANGLVSTLIAGTVDIVATAADGSGVSDSFSLTITSSITPVSDITITSTGDISEIDVGVTHQFTASVLPLDATNPMINWSVINGTGMAAITAGGWVTAVSGGTVEVVATAADGSQVSDSFTLTIIPEEVLVSDIFIISEDNITEIDEGHSLQFSASVLPTDATEPAFLWGLVNCSGTASISSEGLVTGLEAGDVTIVATAQDGSGANDEFTLTINGPNGQSDKDGVGPVLLYPNPSGGIFYLDAGDLQIEKIEVITAAGAVVLELIPRQGEQLIELDLTDQQSGALLIHTLTKTESLVQRAIIIK